MGDAGQTQVTKASCPNTQAWNFSRNLVELAVHRFLAGLCLIRLTRANPITE